MAGESGNKSVRPSAALDDRRGRKSPRLPAVSRPKGEPLPSGAIHRGSDLPLVLRAGR